MEHDDRKRTRKSIALKGQVKDPNHSKKNDDDSIKHLNDDNISVETSLDTTRTNKKNQKVISDFKVVQNKKNDQNLSWTTETSSAIPNKRTQTERKTFIIQTASLNSSVISKKRKINDELIQSSFPASLLQNGNTKGWITEFVDAEKNDVLPISSKLYSSVVDARLFLKKLGKASVQNLKNVSSESNDSISSKMIEPSQTIMKFLFLVGLARQGKMSIPSLLSKVKSLIPPDLFLMFGSFIPNFYSMSHVTPAAKLKIPNLQLSDDLSKFGISARTDIQIIWNKRKKSVSVQPSPVADANGKKSTSTANNGNKKENAKEVKQNMQNAIPSQRFINEAKPGYANNIVEKKKLSNLEHGGSNQIKNQLPLPVEKKATKELALQNKEGKSVIASTAVSTSQNSKKMKSSLAIGSQCKVQYHSSLHEGKDSQEESELKSNIRTDSLSKSQSNLQSKISQNHNSCSKPNSNHPSKSSMKFNPSPMNSSLNAYPQPKVPPNARTPNARTQQLQYPHHHQQLHLQAYSPQQQNLKLNFQPHQHKQNHLQSNKSSKQQLHSYPLSHSQSHLSNQPSIVHYSMATLPHQGNQSSANSHVHQIEQKSNSEKAKQRLSANITHNDSENKFRNYAQHIVQENKKNEPKANTRHQQINKNVPSKQQLFEVKQLNQIEQQRKEQYNWKAKQMQKQKNQIHPVNQTQQIQQNQYQEYQGQFNKSGLQELSKRYNVEVPHAFVAKKSNAFAGQNINSSVKNNAVKQNPTAYQNIAFKGAMASNLSTQKFNVITSNDPINVQMSQGDKRAQHQLRMTSSMIPFQINGSLTQNLFNSNGQTSSANVTNAAYLQQQHKHNILKHNHQQQIAFAQNQVVQSQQKSRQAIKTIDENSMKKFFFNNPLQNSKRSDQIQQPNKFQGSSSRQLTTNHVDLTLTHTQTVMNPLPQNQKKNILITNGPLHTRTSKQNKNMDSSQTKKSLSSPEHRSNAIAKLNDSNNIIKNLATNSTRKNFPSLQENGQSMKTNPVFLQTMNTHRNSEMHEKISQCTDTFNKPSISKGVEAKSKTNKNTTHTQQAIFNTKNSPNGSLKEKLDSSTFKNGSSMSFASIHSIVGSQPKNPVNHSNIGAAPIQPQACSTTNKVGPNQNASTNKEKEYDGRTKPVKAKNPFTHFCRMMKPIVRAELCRNNSAIPITNLKEKIQEETQFRWRALRDEEKQVFVHRSVLDFNRYELEMQIYKEVQQKHLKMDMLKNTNLSWD